MTRSPLTNSTKAHPSHGKQPLVSSSLPQQRGASATTGTDLSRPFNGTGNVAANPGTSSSADVIVATALDKREMSAFPLRVQKLEAALDVTPFIKQVETLLAQPIKIPGNAFVPPRGRQSIFSVRGIWPDEIRKDKASKLYNFKSLKGREWLRDLLLEESDSDDDGEAQITPRDLHALLKVHRMRRRYQKTYHNDKLNSQYTYYSAGLLSTHDQFPEHQATVLRQVTAMKNGLAPPTTIIGGGTSAVVAAILAQSDASMSNSEVDNVVSVPTSSPKVELESVSEGDGRKLATAATNKSYDDLNQPLSIDLSTNTPIIPLPPLSQ